MSKTHHEAIFRSGGFGSGETDRDFCFGLVQLPRLKDLAAGFFQHLNLYNSNLHVHSGPLQFIGCWIHYSKATDKLNLGTVITWHEPTHRRDKNQGAMLLLWVSAWWTKCKSPPSANAHANTKHQRRTWMDEIPIKQLCQTQSNLFLRPPDKRDHLKIKGTQFQSHVVQCIQLFFSQTLFDFQWSVSRSISTKFSGKTPYVLSKPQICFLGSKEKQFCFKQG